MVVVHNLLVIDQEFILETSHLLSIAPPLGRVDEAVHDLLGAGLVEGNFQLVAVDR